MKKGKAPKLGKRAQALLNKQDDNDAASKDPVTAEDFLEQGSIDEESGDRWLGSDLAKSLRFYQKAYTSYLRSIRLQSESNMDSYYNSARLLFQVYYQYFKTEGVNIYDLKNVEEALGGDDNSVVQNLANIISAHETAMRVANNLRAPVPLDLVFNTAVVYTEAIEVEQENPNSNFNQLLEVTHQAQILFLNLLEQQVSEFQKFSQELKEVDYNDPYETPEVINSSEPHEQSKQEEYTSDEVVQPVDILETILASYRLVQAILENVTDFTEQNPRVLELINPLLSKSDEIAKTLIEEYSDLAANKNEMVSNISEEQISELKVAKNYILGLTLNDFEQLFELWANAELPNTSERFMSAADNIQSLLDRNDLTLAFVNSSENLEAKSLFWKALTSMSTNLKKAQDILNSLLTEKKKTPSGVDLGLGALVAQISEVIIARADIELQRCQVTGYEPAEKNAQILLQNSKTLLKNAMNIANTPGGLRERVAEKLQREKKKVDAVIRLCVLEGKTSLQELDSILGRSKWTNELPSLVKLGYFDAFGINNITIPRDF
ncbi:uncharacterized protein RJT20DRAFT_126162 [Scheffersomyces xylosifermentans]|uniref:uncharacterized protein n=1 Tax=Scheffersomyces xylosifermentans TaxID=1304137 RepID=UPI00315CE129